MLSLYDSRNMAVESRDDDQFFTRDSINTICGTIISFEGTKQTVREDIIRSVIFGAQDEVDDAQAIGHKVELNLIETQIQLGRVKLQNQSEEEKSFAKMYDILFNEVLGYRNAIPPVSYHIVEADDQVGPYQLFDCLGEGGFAKVYLCKHENSGSTHAIKCCDKSKIGSITELANLGREIQVLRSEVHENVLECVDVIHAAKNIYLVMDLSCCDLFEYQTKWSDQMTDSVYREIFSGVLQGLECLHHIGVAHMDLKPENILISRDCHPSQLTSKDIKICDFGLCEISDLPMEDIKVRHCVGTPGFMSPELLLGQRDVEGRQCDIFSLGMLFLELMEGGNSHWYRLCTEELEDDMDFDAFPSALNNELMDIHDGYFHRNSAHDLIRRLLVWAPESRYTALEALEHPWLTGDTGKKSEFDK